MNIKISRSMKEAGFERTADQCREKAKKLKMEFRKIKDKPRVTGTGRRRGNFWSHLTKFLGHKLKSSQVDNTHKKTTSKENN